MMNNIKKYLKIFILWLTGGSSYFFLEILFRGRSHWTMFLLGGFCFLLIGALNEYLNLSLFQQGLLGSLIVSCLEFIFGLVLNIYLKLNIWDYSSLPFNILGQVCLPFSILWVFISIFAVFLVDFLRYLFFKEKIPKYKIFK